MKIIAVIIAMFAFVGCSSEDEVLKGEPGEYLIVPLGDADLADCAFAERALEAGLGIDFEIGERLPIPEEAYLEDRFQYDANALLGYITANLPEGAIKGVAVAGADITRTEGDYNYIFGLGSRPGSCCLCSTDRLGWWSETESLYRLRLYKLLIHEVGHTYGLPHCKVNDCIMSSSNSAYEIDEQGIYYCSGCAEAIYGKIGVKPIVRRRAIKAFVKEYGLIE